MHAIQQVFESKWGFHPCDHEEFLKIKNAHKLLLRAYRDCKNYIRWDAKDLKNRKGPEPRAPKELIEHGFHLLNKKKFFGHGFRSVSTRDPKNLYLHVLEQYQKARTPAPNPHAVNPLNLPSGFYDLIDKLQEFYSE